MKICIVGAGGLGGLFGGWLADAGEDVSFIARGAHLQALQTSGLHIQSPMGHRHIADIRASSDPAEIGEVDVVLMCVKNYDLTATARQCRPLIGANTAVISVLNGVNAPAVMADEIDMAHVVAGLTYLPSNIAAPGVIEHKSAFISIVFGPGAGAVAGNVEGFHARCCAAGIDAKISGDIEKALWTKFIGWSASAATTSVSRQPIGVIQNSPELHGVFESVAREAFAVSVAEGVGLADDTIDRLLTTFVNFPPKAKSSTLVDLENGKPLELEAGVGSIIRFAERHGIDVPVSRTVYAALLPFIDGAPV